MCSNDVSPASHASSSQAPSPLLERLGPRELLEQLAWLGSLIFLSPILSIILSLISLGFSLDIRSAFFNWRNPWASCSPLACSNAPFCANLL